MDCTARRVVGTTAPALQLQRIAANFLSIIGQADGAATASYIYIYMKIDQYIHAYISNKSYLYEGSAMTASRGLQLHCVNALFFGMIAQADDAAAVLRGGYGQ